MCSGQKKRKKRNLAKDANLQSPAHSGSQPEKVLHKIHKDGLMKPLKAWTNQHERYLSSLKKKKKSFA